LARFQLSDTDQSGLGDFERKREWLLKKEPKQ